MKRISGMDKDEQPYNTSFNSARRVDRDISELLGLAKGILVDGVVSEEEANYLKEWTRARPDVAQTWPGDILTKRLLKIFEDGIADEDERQDLKMLLQDMVGEKVGIIGEYSESTSLPLTTPKPNIQYEDTLFVLTGKFAMGPRKACESLIYDRGAQCQKNVTKKTDFLVIGTIGSRDWIQSSFGRKIEKAVSYQEEGSPVKIICEQHWAESLN